MEVSGGTCGNIHQSLWKSAGNLCFAPAPEETRLCAAILLDLKPQGCAVGGIHMGSVVEAAGPRTSPSTACTIHVKKELASYYPPSVVRPGPPGGMLIICSLEILSDAQKWILSGSFGGSHVAWHMAATLAWCWTEAASASRLKWLSPQRFWHEHRAARDYALLNP